MRIVSATVFMLLAGAAFPAFAQDAVRVRANVQDGFVRLVLSGEGMPQASVSDIDKTSLKITFAKAVSFEGVDSAMRGITPTTGLTADSDRALVLKVEGDTVKRHRVLSLGSRVFVDVFTGQTPSFSEKAAAAEAAPAFAPDASAAVSPADQPGDAALSSGPAPVPVASTVPASADVVTPASDKAFTGSAVVTIGSTDGLSLAAFSRAGYLWIVAAQERLSVPPVVSGPDAALLGPVQSFPVSGGSAFRLRLPPGAAVRPEGAGLVWRFYVEGRKTDLATASIERDFSSTAQGPQIHVGLKSVDSVLRLSDPAIGDDLAVVTVGRSGERLVNSDRYVDFDVLPAFVGAVFKPKADGLRVALSPDQVVIGREGGLHLSPEGPRAPVPAARRAAALDRTPKKQAVPRLFHLAEWSSGGPAQYFDSRRALDLRIAMASESQKVAELIAAAKFMLGQGLAQEGLGFLNMAVTYLPLLYDSADFQAVRGALLAMAGQGDDAMNALSTPGLETQPEVQLWQAYVLAQQGDMSGAGKRLTPVARDFLPVYPARVQAVLLPPLIDAVLAQGDAALAESMINWYQDAADSDSYPDAPLAVSYYRGRLALLRGDAAGANDSFRDAAEGVRGPYPVRATLALVERGLSSKSLTRDEAVAKLERFRYGWRGDALESEVLQRLGLLYVTGGEQRRGLTILRDAVSMAPDAATRDKLVAVMQKAFRELFSGRTREKMSPIEAAAVATDFAELMPSGPEGEAISLTIADKMMAVDLLDRAAGVIEPLVTSAASASNALQYAAQAAAIRLEDDNPEAALRIIDKVLGRADVQALSPMPPKDLKALALLRASARAQQKKYPAALAELASVPEDSDVLRLKADIAWAGQKWLAAADSMGKLIGMAHLDALRPPTHEQAQMILNRALALNLSGDVAELENLRLGYGDIMRRSDLYQPFQLVTRTAREAKLADRETLLKLVSEVNMFKSVLDAYRGGAAASKPDAGAATKTQ